MQAVANSTSPGGRTKAALPPAEAVGMLETEADRGPWEPRIVRAFVQLLPLAS